MERNEGGENLKSLGDILGRVIFVCISNNVPADFNTLIHELRKLLFGLLLHLEINYVNSCGWRDRIEGRKQPLSRGQGAGTPGLVKIILVPCGGRSETYHLIDRCPTVSFSGQ